MLDALGVEWLKPEDLPAINERGERIRVTPSVKLSP